MVYKEYFCKKLPQCVETQQGLQKAYKTIEDLKTSHTELWINSASNNKALTDYHTTRYKELDKEFESYIFFSSGVIAILLACLLIVCSYL